MELAATTNQDRLLQQLADVGVILRPGHMFFVDPHKSHNSIRIVIGSPDTQDELFTALTRLAKTVRS